MSQIVAGSPVPILSLKSALCALSVVHFPVSWKKSLFTGHIPPLVHRTGLLRFRPARAALNLPLGQFVEA